MAKSTEPNQLDLISFNLAFKTDCEICFYSCCIVIQCTVFFAFLSAELIFFK